MMLLVGTEPGAGRDAPQTQRVTTRCLGYRARGPVVGA